MTRQGSMPTSFAPAPTYRIDRILANLGYGSRTDAKVLVARRRVRIDDELVVRPEQLADPSRVTLDHEPLDRPTGISVVLHKPLDVVCSHDEREGTRVFDLLPPRWLGRNPQVVSAGRLDKDSTGLIFITDNHELVHRLTSPKRHVTKRYEVRVDGEITPETVERFASGELLMAGDSVPCRAATLTILGPRHAEVILTEGRNRQLRRMFVSCGLTVEALHRTDFGSLSLGELGEGEWRDIEKPEM